MFRAIASRLWLKLFLLYRSYFVIVLPPLRVIEIHTVAQPEMLELVGLTRPCMRTDMLGGCFQTFLIRLHN